jgi:S-DNA-T family DNA segregation ATPase FtsK/SpoIIIE
VAKDKEPKKEQKNGKKDKRRWHDDLHHETKQSVWAVLSFGMAMLLLLAWSGKAGVVGDKLYWVFNLLFGKAFFIVPIALIAAGISLLFSLRERVFAGTFFGAGMFLVSSLGLTDTLFGAKTAGYVGLAISYLPMRFMDFWASLVVFGVLFIISLLVMLNTPLRLRRALPTAEDLKRLELEASQKPKGTEEPGMFDTAKAALASGVSGVAKVFEKKEDPRPEVPQVPETKEPELIPTRMMTHIKNSNYKTPPISLLEDDRGKPSSGDIKANANIIQRTLQNFGIDVDMGEISIGPAVTQYTLRPAEGVKLSRITALSNDLGLALSAHPIRIEAPIPGKSLVGIEVPNKSIAFVGLRSLMTELVSRKDRGLLSFAVGRDVSGQAAFADLARMPHLLIAGSTGSGKSVSIHSLLLNLLFNNSPETLRLLLIDPKRVELTYYNDIPHLLTPVIVEAKQAIQSLRWAVKQMEARYQILSAAGARDIQSYNADADEIMPYMVIVIDELADLMTTYPRDVEASIVRLAQMARAVGIHLVVSTQRPSVEVITGLIKANITSRMALHVVSQIDSRTILDMSGAEKLLGHGDMLYLAGDVAKPRRIQGAYVSDGEVKKTVEYLKNIGDAEYEETIFAANQTDILGGAGGDDVDDDLYEEARHLVIETQKASTTYLQRKLSVGYARAARLMDILEERGVIGPGNGAKPRDILVKETPFAIEQQEA